MSKKEASAEHDAKVAERSAMIMRFLTRDDIKALIAGFTERHLAEGMHPEDATTDLDADIELCAKYLAEREAMLRKRTPNKEIVAELLRSYDILGGYQGKLGL